MILVGVLVPWLAFLAATTVTSGVADSNFFFAGTIVTAPFYWVAVGLPSLATVVAARHRRVAGANVVVMTAVAVFAGIKMAASDDAQAGLAVLVVPMVGAPLALFTWIGESVAGRFAADRNRTGGSLLVAADLNTRMCALAVDVAVAGAFLYIPLTALSHADQEIAAVLVGLAAGTAYLGLPLVWRGQTLGQGLLDLHTVDAATGGFLPLGRALGRSLALALEVLGAATFILAIPAVADFVAVSATGRSLLDRLFRTAVLARRQSGRSPRL
jgi:hypothetical protein